MKEERESDRFFVDTGDDYFRSRLLGEKRLVQLFLSRNACVAKSLVFRETLDELENQWNVRFGGGPNVNRIRQSPGPR